jgi:tetratricopeptide (TPR) repeat protein
VAEGEVPSRREPGPKPPTPAERRREVEARISTGAAPLSDASRLDLDDELDAVLHALFVRFRRSWLESTKLETAVEIARVLELKLTLLRNYAFDPTSDARSLAIGLRAIFAEAGAEKLGLASIEHSYLKAILAVYGGDPLSGLTELDGVFGDGDTEGFVGLLYHARMIASHLRHELSEFATARDHADSAADLATSPNPAAQALAVAGVNSFAMGQRDRAMRELEDALRYFDESEPLFNPYFFRNTLLLCGLICFERGDDEAAESFCRRAVEHAEPATFDAFEAWSRLGRVLYRQKKIEEAADAFEHGIAAYRHGESEVLLDVCLWLARACLSLGRTDRARILLLRIVTSEVDYPSSEDARRLLAQIPPVMPGSRS